MQVKELKVGDIMTKDLVTLEQDESLEIAGEVMRFGRLRHLPVVRGGKLVGLVTHRDLLRASMSSLAKVHEHDRDRHLKRIPAIQIMNRDVDTVSPDMPVKQACDKLLAHKYGCLPVVDGTGRLVGIVTEADFVKLMREILTSAEASR